MGAKDTYRHQLISGHSRIIGIELNSMNHTVKNKNNDTFALSISS